MKKTTIKPVSRRQLIQFLALLGTVVATPARGQAPTISTAPAAPFPPAMMLALATSPIFTATPSFAKNF
jgi:hypothetical protein